MSTQLWVKCPLREAGPAQSERFEGLKITVALNEGRNVSVDETLPTTNMQSEHSKVDIEHSEEQEGQGQASLLKVKQV